MLSGGFSYSIPVFLFSQVFLSCPVVFVAFTYLPSVFACSPRLSVVFHNNYVSIVFLRCAFPVNFDYISLIFIVSFEQTIIGQ